MAARVEHERHQAAADDKREEDAEPHRDSSFGRDRRSLEGAPRVDRKPNRNGEEGDERDKDKQLAHHKNMEWHGGRRETLPRAISAVRLGCRPVSRAAARPSWRRLQAAAG